jgi:hypothetical protein
MLIQVFLQGGPGNVTKHKIGPKMIVTVIEQGNQARVFERSQEMRFLMESLDDRNVFREVGANGLEGDKAPRPLVPRKEHFPHSPGSQQCASLITMQRIADKQSPLASRA